MTVTGKPLFPLRLSRVRNALLVTVSGATAIQLSLFFSINNLIASGVLLFGAFVGFAYSMDRQLLDDYPLSTMTIAGYTVCRFLVPPLGKLADFQGILHGLNHPILVWVYELAGLFALVGAHYLYRKFSPLRGVRRILTRRFYRPMHFFEMPNQIQFWLMGAVGIVATLVVLRHLNGGQGTVARVLLPLIYVPYFAFFPTLLDPRYETPQKPIRVTLILYTILLIGVSAMINSRGFMLVGFASLACVYGYRVFTGTIQPPKLSMKALIIIAAGCWIATGPVANMAASMIVAREMRGRVSAPELAKKTWDVYR
ncbi:MAG: hypothetical protein ACRD3F_07355, partial [Acidobacteriaceae bacterium]